MYVDMYIKGQVVGTSLVVKETLVLIMMSFVDTFQQSFYGEKERIFAVLYFWWILSFQILTFSYVYVHMYIYLYTQKENYFRF